MAKDQAQELAQAEIATLSVPLFLLQVGVDPLRETRLYDHVDQLVHNERGEHVCLHHLHPQHVGTLLFYAREATVVKKCRVVVVSAPHVPVWIGAAMSEATS